MEPRWNALIAALTTEPTRAVFHEIVSAYTAPDRHYHNLQHIEHALQTVDGLKSLAKNPTALQLAVWFHDLVYESRNHDNEERSAARADEILAGWKVTPALRHQVTALILATKKHQAAAGDLDTQVLLDADLAILSEPPSRYQAYARAIRQEYSWVSDDEFRQDRRKVLENFLHREHIYFTADMRQRDAMACDNMRAERQALD